MRRLFLTVLVVLGLALPLLPGSVATADEARVDSVTMLDGSLGRSLVPRSAPSLTITGRGYGHGHGMSQYAAQNRARNGQGYRRILRFYYPGLSLATRGGSIRVHVSADRTDRVLVRARSHLAVRKVGGGRWINLAKARPRADRWRLVPRPNDRRRVDFRVNGSWRTLTIIGGASEFVAGGRPITLAAGGSWVAYRGALRSARGDTVNVLALQQYVKGVVPREVPALWHPHAVRAQAVAARTYAARQRTSPLAGHYDICDTTSCQAYGGFSAEHDASNAAVRDTAHEVLLAGGTPAFTQYSASNGGHTAKGSFGYLPGKWDGFDRWAGNPHRWWQVRIGAARIESAFPGIGRLQRVRVLQRDGNGQWGGRVLQIRVVGSRSATTVTGNTFRSRLGLKSTYFTVG